MNKKKNAQVDLDVVFCKSCRLTSAAANSFLYGPISSKCKTHVQITWPEGSIECSGADL